MSTSVAELARAYIDTHDTFEVNVGQREKIDDEVLHSQEGEGFRALAETLRYEDITWEWVE